MKLSWEDVKRAAEKAFYVWLDEPELRWVPVQEFPEGMALLQLLHNARIKS